MKTRRLISLILVGVFVVFYLVAPVSAKTKSKKSKTITITKKQFDAMMKKFNAFENQIKSLKKEINELKKQKTQSVPKIKKDDTINTESSSQPLKNDDKEDDTKLLESLQSEMKAEDTSPPAKAEGSKFINPRISVNADLVWNINHNKKIDGGSAVNLRELELGFEDKIDPWSQANIYAAFHNENGDYHVHLEEAYLTYNKLPLGSQVRAGKFFLPFGKDNQTHQHARPYVDIPNVINNFLGPEGQAGTGAEVSAVIPVGNLYTELKGAVINDEGPASFTNGKSGKPLYLGRFRTYADISDSSNIELGYSHLRGFNNEAATRLSRINGIDLTYRWRPLLRGKYNSLMLRGEYLWSRRTNLDRVIKSKGYYAFGQYQLNRNWYLGSRYDYSEFPNLVNTHENAISGILTYYPTEFLYYRLQYKNTKRNYAPSYNQWLFQINFLMGPHGAHSF